MHRRNPAAPHKDAPLRGIVNGVCMGLAQWAIVAFVVYVVAM